MRDDDPQQATSANPRYGASEPGEDRPSSPLMAPFRAMGRLLPFWAWVLIFGAILALIVALGAVFSMRTTDVGPAGGSGTPTRVTPSYAAPTTTGKWDNGPEIGGGDGSSSYYDPGYSYWTPTQQAPTSTTSAPSAKPTAPHPEPPRGDNPGHASGNGNNPAPGNSPGGNTGGGGGGHGNTGGGTAGTDGGATGGTSGGGRTETGTGTGGNSGTGTGGNSGTGTGGGGTTGGNRNAG